MNDESQTYTAREIVLEFFPATHQRLVPADEALRVEHDGQGNLLVLSHRGQPLLRLSPVSTVGNAASQLCCDFCYRSAPRSYLQLFRAEAPLSQGRRYRYVSLCRDPQGCRERRLDDLPIRTLLSRLFR